MVSKMKKKQQSSGVNGQGKTWRSGKIRMELGGIKENGLQKITHFTK